VQEFAELGGAHGAEAGGEVEDAVAGHPARQPVVERIGQAPVGIGLAIAAARAHGHVEARVELFQQQGDMRRIMLAIGIHEDQHLARGRARAAFDRRTVAHRVWRRQHGGAELGGHSCGGIGGAVVDH
jgi:hypothetical protein